MSLRKKATGNILDRAVRFLMYSVPTLVLFTCIFLYKASVDYGIKSQLSGTWENREWTEEASIFSVHFEGNKAYIRHKPSEREITYDYTVRENKLVITTTDPDGLSWKYPIVTINESSILLKDGRKICSLSPPDDM